MKAASDMAGLRFDNSFARLPAAFYTRLDADPLPQPYPVAVSGSAAGLLGLRPGELTGSDWVEALAGNRQLPGSEPLAAVYSGHQFGVWAGQLGDGRALLLGEAVGAGGQHWEIQLKGAGKTPYSRMGDGRAVLRSSIREFLCSEAMAHLGIPTSRALAVVGSDLPVFRETVETAAVATRMAPSFIRFGSFEHFYAARQPQRLRELADYVIDRFYPEARDDRDSPNPYASLLRRVSERTARLIAQWQAVGFCHGVMNTDNMSILGLTIDYGPFGFLDGFQANHICNHSDDGGRYAYAMQPRVGEWNSFCLGQALIPLIESVELAEGMLAHYKPVFDAALAERLRAKLGLVGADQRDAALLERLFAILDAGRVDFTLFFRRLSAVRSADASGDTGCRDLFIDRAAFDAWAVDYRGRLQADARPDAERAAAMNRVNPKYVLRNHLAETAIRAARGSHEQTRLAGLAPESGPQTGTQTGTQIGTQTQPAAAGDSGADWLSRGDQDFSEVQRLLKVLEHPYDEQPEFDAYAGLPPDWAGALEVSCSS